MLVGKERAIKFWYQIKFLVQRKKIKKQGEKMEKFATMLKREMHFHNRLFQDPFICVTGNFKPLQQFMNDYPQGYGSTIESFYVRATGLWNGIEDYTNIKWYKKADAPLSKIEEEYFQCWEFSKGNFFKVPCGASYAIYPYNKPGVPNGVLAVSGRLEMLTKNRDRILVIVYDPNLNEQQYYCELWLKK